MDIVQAYAALVAGLGTRHPATGSFPSSVRGMSERIVQLPLANPELASRELSKLLHEHLHTICTGQDRVETLGIMRRTVLQLDSGFERQIISESFPLNKVKFHMATTAIDMHTLLARGYSLALHELCAPKGKLPFMGKKLIAEVLLLALAHLGWSMHWQHRLYSKLPDRFWAHAHALYAFSILLSLHDRPVSVKREKVSCRDRYAHLLLFALGNPYGLTIPEMNDAFALTKALAPHCHLAEGLEAGIAVDAGTDGGPGYLPEERVSGRPGGLSIDVVPVQELINKNIESPPAGTQTLHFRINDKDHEFSRPFIDRLLVAWCGVAARNRQRLPAGHCLEAVVGLHSVHRALAEGSNFDEFMVQIHGAGISLDSQEPGASWASHGGSAGLVIWQTEVLDQGLGGYRLQWPFDTATRIKVGELVALALPVEMEARKEWMIGVIRWLRVTAPGQIETGVELLARHALAAAVRAADSKGLPGVSVRALYCHDDDRPTLFVSNLFTQQSKVLELNVPDDPSDWHPSPSAQLFENSRYATISASYLRIDLQNTDSTGPHV